MVIICFELIVYIVRVYFFRNKFGSVLKRNVLSDSDVKWRNDNEINIFGWSN